MPRPKSFCEHATPRCSECSRARQRLWNKRSHARHREQRAVQRKEYKAANPEKVKAIARTAVAKYRRQHHDRLKSGRRDWFTVPRNRYSVAKAAAARRGLGFTITLDEYLALVTPNECRYCAGPLPLTGCGLDRVDNDQGYAADNVVACCADCNYARGGRFTHEEMFIVGRAIREVHAQRASAERIAC